MRERRGGFQAPEFGVHAEEIEGVAEDELPGREGVEVVEDFGGYQGVDVEEGGGGWAVRDGGYAHGGEGVGDVFRWEEV